MQSENISTPIYVEFEKTYPSKVCVQEFWYIMSGLDVQPEKSENDNSACKKVVPGCDTGRAIYSFFRRINTNLWLSAG